MEHEHLPPLFLDEMEFELCGAEEGAEPGLLSATVSSKNDVRGVDGAGYTAGFAASCFVEEGDCVSRPTADKARAACHALWKYVNGDEDGREKRLRQGIKFF